MTDSTLSKKTFQVNGKEWPLFVAGADNHFRMHTVSLADSVKTNFAEKIAKLQDRHDDLGRADLRPGLQGLCG
ncbi:MAG: hypothetical protein MZU79_05880 [Anaerotruncus sp.]|nr:hypothetical protein [Anaerotruncus sp.]